MGMDHVIERARERYGLELSTSDVKFLKKLICQGQSVLVERRPSEGIDVHLVQLKPGMVVKVVWHPEKQLILTLLPRLAKCGRGHRYGMAETTRLVNAEALKKAVGDMPIKELGRLSGVDHTEIRRWLGGSTRASARLIGKVAYALHMRPALLTLGDEK